MNTREDIYAKIKELQAEGKDYDAIVSTFILEVLIDIRDLLKPTKISVVDQGGILPTSTYDIE